jgi:hypothetical protein
MHDPQEFAQRSQSVIRVLWVRSGSTLGSDPAGHYRALLPSNHFTPSVFPFDGYRLTTLRLASFHLTATV